MIESYNDFTFTSQEEEEPSGMNSKFFLLQKKDVIEIMWLPDDTFRFLFYTEIGETIFTLFIIWVYISSLGL